MTTKDARRLLAPLKDDLLDLLSGLVRADTVAVPPDGNEAAGQKVLARFCRRHRLDAELYQTDFLLRSRHPYVRRERNYAGRCNLIARLGGTGGGRSLLLSGHIDTVPPGEARWKDSPFSAAIRGGRLYGRGSFDMKGGLAAQFVAMAALRRAGLRLRGDLLCESVVDEEWAGGGGTLAGRLRGDTADAAVIPEGTNLAVVRATRGGHFFEITARAGDAAGYFSKQEVVSPAVPMGRLLGWVGEWTARRAAIKAGGAYAGFADPVPVQVLALEANRFEPDVPWSVPLEAKLRLYFQFLPDEDVPAVIGEIRKSFDAFCRKDAFFRQYPPAWRDVVYPPLLGHELAADHPWTQALASAAAGVTKAPAVVSAAPYPCDAFMLQGQFGIPTLLFGPSGGGAHNVDEYVNIRSVMQTAQTLLAAAMDWCG